MKDYAGKLLKKALGVKTGIRIRYDDPKAVGADRVADAVAVHTLYGGIAAYGKHFAKTKQLDPKFHRWLRDGFETRITGDYGVDTGIEEEIAVNMINQAREFLEAARLNSENKANEA